MSKLRFSNEREQSANRLVDEKAVSRVVAEDSPAGQRLRGKVKDGRVYEPELTIDRDQRLASATCTCNFYTQNKLYKGPCEHILALRISHRRTQG
jgi:predicted nucleic acid-binding Zn finger protein